MQLFGVVHTVLNESGLHRSGEAKKHITQLKATGVRRCGGEYFEQPPNYRMLRAKRKTEWGTLPVNPDFLYWHLVRQGASKKGIQIVGVEDLKTIGLTGLQELVTNAAQLESRQAGTGREFLRRMHQVIQEGYGPGEEAVMKPEELKLIAELTEKVLARRKLAAVDLDQLAGALSVHRAVQYVRNGQAARLPALSIGRDHVFELMHLKSMKLIRAPLQLRWVSPSGRFKPEREEQRAQTRVNAYLSEKQFLGKLQTHADQFAQSHG